MPKMKTHRGAAKRFRHTAGGKLLRRRGYKSHILEKKSPKRKRSFRRTPEVSHGDRRNAEKMLAKR